jgi:hypothetical protein
VEVCEEDLILLHLRPFIRQGLLHLHDHVGFPPDRIAVADNLGAAIDILFVADAAALPRTGFDEHLVPAARQFLDADRRHGHAVLIRLHFFRHADNHGPPP